MAGSEKVHETGVNGGEEGEGGEGKLEEGMAMLDFDMLCSTVAMQTQGKWTKLELDEDFEAGEFGGVLRMWEGEVLDCLDDRRVAMEAAW